MKRVLITIVVLIVSWASTAHADDLMRVVVLKVREGDTEQLAAEIGSVPNVETRDHGWFVREVKARRLKVAQIMRRPADLRFVMSGSNIRYIIFVELSDDGYYGRIFDGQGEVVREKALGGEFGTDEALEVRNMFERELGLMPDESVPSQGPEIIAGDIPTATPVPVGEPQEASQPDEPKKPKRRKAKKAKKEKQERVPAAGAQSATAGFELAVDPRLFKRDLSFSSGTAGSVLNYNSGLYPGVTIEAAYTLDVEILTGLLGFWTALDLGFDSVTSGDAKTSIIHLEAALGAHLRFGWFSVRVGGRHVRYINSDDAIFPSLEHSHVLIGLDATHAIERVELRASAEAAPWGIYGASGEFFGETSSELGFGASMRVGYRLSDLADLHAGYGFRLGRSQFRGAGGLDFVDSVGFELVHGPRLGIGFLF